MQKYCKKGIQTNKNPAPAGLLFLAFISTLNGFIDWTPSVSQGLEMALKRDNGLWILLCRYKDKQRQ